MSFGVPIAYNQLENNLAIPSQLVGDDLKSFGKGARNNVRSVPTSSGAVGPSSTLLFNLPVGGYDYIKSNSMYLKCTVEINATHAANTSASSIFFAGNMDPSIANISNIYSVGGASSLINRVNCMIGGTSLSYPNYDHFRNAVMPHILGQDYIQSDLRTMEYAGVGIDGGNASAGTTLSTLDVAIPLLGLAPFNANQAFPALLISSPISIEILTESINAAFYSIQTTVTGYTIRNASLIYETITVSSEFKQALLQSKAGQMYNIKLNDWMSVGPTATQDSLTYQIGCGLSSLRAVVWTHQLNDDVSTTIAKPKRYHYNGLSDYKVYVNNLQISVNNPDSDAIAYAEMNRALSRLNDYNVTSLLGLIPNVATSATVSTGLRNTYTLNNFLAGASVDVFSDFGYDQTGVPASTVTLELKYTGATAGKWQSAANHAASALYVFLLHDSTLSVDVSSGVVMVRK